MPQWLGGPELIVILLIVVILFGWKKLPDAARSLGRSMRIFKAEVEEMRRDDAPSAASKDTVKGSTVPASQAGATAAPPPAAGPTVRTQQDETPAEREARLRAEAEARLDAEDAERARIEAQLRAERAERERAAQEAAARDDLAH